MKKVLLVVPLSTLDWGSKNSGGVDSVCQMLVKHLATKTNSNFHYRILAFDPFSANPYTGEIIQLSPTIQVVVCPVAERRIGLKLPGFISASLRVREQEKQYKPDIIHSHIGSWLLGAPSRCKRILTLHAYKNICRKHVSFANDFLYVKLIPSATRKYVDHYTCVGNIIKESVEKDVNVPVIIIRNPVDENYFIERDNEIPESNIFSLVTCSLLSRRKNIGKAIELVSALKKAGHIVQLKVIGPISEPVYYRELQELVIKHNVKNEVNFVGGLNQQEIINEYKQANVGVYFSKQETFGLAPLEMLAAGLPLLTTSVGVLDEQRDEFETRGVIYVDQNNIDQQVEAIIKLARTRTYHIADFIKDKYCVNNILSDYENIYKGVFSAK